MLKNLMAVLRNEDGATMVEYALLVALIAAALVTIINTFEGDISTQFSTTGKTIS